MTINAEWDQLREVFVHRPGVEIDYAMLAPKPFLFERPYKTHIAIKEHEVLEQMLRDEGVKVTLLRDAVSEMYESSSKFRRALRNKLLETVKFKGDRRLSERERRSFKKNVASLDPRTIFNILLIAPTVILKDEGESDPGYPEINSNLPLANLYFMRDQQAVAGKGIFVGKMRKKHRARENDITQFILEGAFPKERVRRLKGRGYFEGGDYIPAGEFGLIGTGPRTTRSGAIEFMESRVHTAKEFLVVTNPVYEFMKGDKRGSMVNMHLDTYFNIAGKGLAITSLELAERASGYVYYLDGGHAIRERKTTLMGFLREKGYDFIDLSLAEQLSYSSNFLTIKDRHILAIDAAKVLHKLRSRKVFSEKIESRIEKELPEKSMSGFFPKSKAVRDYGLDVSIINLSEITGGYGGAHCMTASISRS